MEEIKYGEDIFEIPSGLCDDFSYLLDIISPDTWNNILTDEHREMLMKFLPDFPEDDLNEKTHTLEMFFMNENFYFGSPLQNFFINLKKGFYNPDVARVRKIHRKMLLKSYKYRQKKYFHNMLEEILVKRKEMLEGVKKRGFDQDHNYLYKPNNSSPVLSKREMCIQRARKRYYKEIRSVKSEAGCDSDLSDDDNPEGIGLSLNKKQRRQLFLLEASFPSNLCPVRSTHTRGSLALDLEANLTSARNPFDSSEEQFRNLLVIHLAKQKRKKSFTFDTRGITLKSILERTEMLTKKPLQRPTLVSSPVLPARPMLPVNSIKRSPSKKKVKSPSTNYPLIPIENVKREPSSDSMSSDGETTQDIDVTKDSYCASPASSTLDDIKSSIAAELTQETHLSFFSLLRDIFCSTANQRMGRQQLGSSISTWQDSAISPLNEWFCLCDSWVNVLPSAINFLCGNVSSEYLLPDFVPFIEYKNTLKYFQWIGAGRDSDSNLEPLSQYWLSNCDNIGLDWPKDVIFSSDSEDTKPSLSLPAKSPKNWSIKRPSDGGETPENFEYHKQERNRYGQPHKAFTYRMNGYESVIGPVKGVYTQQQSGNTTKARGHLLLVPDRPPFVTILSLVWDSVARLPNSEGTKLDICELLKESQFLVPINTQSLENNLNNVVSGALDRLQNEKDPCVKFDTSRKLWVYLHKSRSEKELEMMHQLKLRSGSNKSKSTSSTRKSVKKKEDASLNQGPPNVSMEQYSPAIKHMDGSEVRIKDEDILKNWVKIASSKTKKKESKISPAQLKQEFNKMKKLNLTTLENPVLVCTSESLPTEFTTKAIMQSACITDEPKVVVSGEVSPQKICTTIPFSKVSTTLLHTTPSTSTVLTSSEAVKLQLQAQSRKYQSSDKKKSTKQETVSSTPKTTTTTILTTTTPTKLYHTQPVMTSAVMTQPKGIKLVQYSNPNIQAKGVVGNASLVMDTSNAMPAALVGQKLVVAGNRVLVQGGKVLHNVAAANVTGRTKQMLTGVVPAQHIMAMNNLKKQTTDQHSLEGVLGALSSAGGRFIQIATVDAPAGYQKQTGYQKLTLVPQFSQATLATGGQKLQEATAMGTLAKGSITAGELKLKLGSTAFATAAGNIISLGGKQILLTTKGSPNNRTAQIHQIVLPASTSGQQATVVSTSTAVPVTVPTTGAVAHQSRLGIGGQQIMVPASALAGSNLNLKRLQAFQSFKVVPASQLTQQQQQQQRGKPVVAHILAPVSTTTTSTGGVPTAKLSLQVATTSGNSLDKSNM